MRRIDHHFKADDLRKHLTGRVQSGAWWIFVTTSPFTADRLVEIGGTFYGGSSADDYEVAILPSQLGEPAVVACGHKRRLSAGRLLQSLATFIKPPTLEVARSVLAERRHVLFFNDDGPTNVQALTMAFLNYIEPEAALRRSRVAALN